MSSRTQIIASIGPSSDKPEIIRAMIEAGMDMARINFSHGERANNIQMMHLVRECARGLGKNILIIQDLSGPRLQSGTTHSFDARQSTLTEKDRADLAEGVAAGVDYIAQSFVGTAQDVAELRSELQRLQSTAKIIAKIERQEALENFDAICSVADAIMIARGDLGEAISIEDMPFVERDLLERARRAHKPCIVATQMLYSMVTEERPTRAEVTDEAYAILSGADAVMLSDETARGKYPVESVAMMERIAVRAEREYEKPSYPLT